MDRFNTNEDPPEFDDFCFDEGRESRACGQKLGGNPWERGTWKHKSWSAGWFDKDQEIISKEEK